MRSRARHWSAALAAVGCPPAGAGPARQPGGPAGGAEQTRPGRHSRPSVSPPHSSGGKKCHPRFTEAERGLSGCGDDNYKFQDLKNSWALSPKDGSGVVRHTLFSQPDPGLSEGNAKSVPESTHHVSLQQRKRLPLFLIFLETELFVYKYTFFQNSPTLPKTFSSI